MPNLNEDFRLESAHLRQLHIRGPMNRIIFCVFIVLFSLDIWSCPLGAKEDHLTVQRVMRNFGRFVMPAEMIAYRGQNKNEMISDVQLQEAIEKLSLVISCANAVLENPTGDLIPVVARDLSEPEKSKYLDSYLFFMDEFKASITDYQSAFIKIQAKPESERDYFPLLELTRKQDALIDRAHGKL